MHLSLNLDGYAESKYISIQSEIIILWLVIEYQLFKQITFYVKLTLSLPDQICDSLYCQLYNSHNVSSENLVLDQLTIPKLIFFFILITYRFDVVLIL